MFSTGVDIEKIDRFNDINQDFINKVYTKNEIEYCNNKKNPAQHFAARFCAKEAVVKALTSLNIKLPNLKEIEVISQHDGVPVIKLLCIDIPFDIKLSLSHCEDTAIAFVVVTGK